MKYQINLYNAERETIATATENGGHVWQEGRAVSTIYATAAAIMEGTPTAAAFRVYSCNLVYLALQCATATARTAANRGGRAMEGTAAAGTAAADYTPTEKAAAEKAARKMSRQTAAARPFDTQSIIYRDLTIVGAATAAAMASGGAAFDCVPFILDKIAATSHDTRDFFGECIAAAYENANGGADMAATAAAIYAAANKYIRGNVTRREREVSTEFIMDGGGDLVTWGTAAAYILHGGEKWTPTAAANMDAPTAARLGECLAAAFALLSPVCREVVRHIVNGYSVRQTAARMRRNVRTIERNIDTIRATFGAYIAENAAEFTPIIKAATAATAAKRERENAATAARMREYRARKKAAATAAANA